MHSKPFSRSQARLHIIWASILLFTSLSNQTEAVIDSTNLMELSFEELLQIKVDSVYAASKHQQSLAQAPASVTIISDDEIKKFGHRTLADALRSVRGIYVTYDRNYSFLGVRGFSRPGDYNSRLLVLVNGHRLNDNIFDSALIGNEFPLDVDVIDRIEVIRGPSSSIYGNNAFFGVINVITKTGRDLDGAVVSGEAGHFDSYKGIFSYGKKFENEIEWILSGSYYQSDGDNHLFFPEEEFANPLHNFGVAKRADREESYRYMSMLSYRDFTIQGAFSYREKHVPTGSFGTVLNDPRMRTVDIPAYLDLKFQRFLTDTLELTARSYYDYYHYYGYYPYEEELNKDVVTGNRWGTEIQARQTLFDDHTLTLGAEFTDNFRQDQLNYNVDPRELLLDDRRDSYNWAVFSQAEIVLLGNLTLSAGVRYDKFETFGDSINPRLGLIYMVTDDTALKALYGTAFRAPNNYELYYSAPGSKANPGLKPEDIETYELVLEQKLPKNLRFIVSGFRYQAEHLINLETDPADDLLTYRNVERVCAQGVEFELQGRPMPGLQTRVSYTIQRAENDETGELLSNSPQHLAKLNLSVPLFQDKIFSGLEFQYRGEVQTLQNRTLDDFFIVNLTLFSRNIVPGLELSGTVYNLFDESYAYPGSSEHVQDLLQQDGRGFRVKLSYMF